jgi:multisubunit Na+/H+ antiporter MnhB subunit
MSMSPHQIIAVAVRLFAVWFAIHIPGNLYAFYGEGTKFGGSHTVLFTFIAAAVALGIVAALWTFPMMIASKLLTTKADPSIPEASPDTWLALGCALIGLWILTDSLPGLIRDSLVYIYYSSQPTYGQLQGLLPSILYLLAEVIIGLWLILGAKGFRRVFRWARYAGIEKVAPTDSGDSRPPVL